MPETTPKTSADYEAELLESLRDETRFSEKLIKFTSSILVAYKHGNAEAVTGIFEAGLKIFEVK